MKVGKKYEIPPVGLRIIKSAVAIALCYVVSSLRGGSGIVFYSQLAALWCMQLYVKNSVSKAKQRTIGTIIGALYGLVVILVGKQLHISPIEHQIIYDISIAFMIIVVIYTTVLINRKEASYFSCVVFLSIVVNHIADQNPYLFVWNRFLDTMIGILIALLVNSFHLPKQKNRDILFLSGLDDTLLNKKDNMSAYSRFELNRILDDGANFTIATKRTPASMLEPMRDIRLNLPVIAMDGAVLYDIKQKQYKKKYVISYQKAKEMLDLIKEQGIHCFTNVIIDDMLVIYYEEMEDEVQNQLVQEMRRSPFRNYVKRPLPEQEEVVYIMILDKMQRVEEFYQILQEMGYTERFKVLLYESDDYPGYGYIKIYNKNASKKNMLDYLKKEIGIEKVVTFGTIPNQYNVLIEPGDMNRVVRVVKKMYEPLKWLPKKSRIG
ncbi:HAD hydrolase family protein [Anaerosporobacter faecicola]|uniref:HAD hydrolase family protein n=1 Tax=Anaerosporobacter faecicola TaxID=2718714 RepID=UPI00143BCE91|nr:HAD hydrolase family protein [Anaerosporobacter faecicola]